MEKSSYLEKQNNGQEVLRFKTNKKYSKKERAEQWKEAEKAIHQGKQICLSDLMINAGM